jgi:hypothetical protein
MGTVSAFPKQYWKLTLDEADRLRLCDAVEQLDAVLRQLPRARQCSDYFVTLGRLLRGLPVDERRVVVENLSLLTISDLH